ncbi:MAG: helix-turn-helix transcriptional regulator, partial [Candidatus Accumulibacter sp.]|nr:helix-turn-helix transcriptional regulator [Accumulibacter sp.]
METTKNREEGTLGNRLRACRKAKGLTQKEVEARAGVSQGTLSELENDKYPTSTFVPQLAELYGVEALWLATGEGRKVRDDTVEGAPTLGRSRKVPVVGTSQLGDSGFWAELNTPVGFGDGHIPFPVRSERAYAVRCKGDSMKPRIKDGEFVIVDPDQSPVPGDEVLVKSSDGRVMVKEFLYRRDGFVHLLSVNEEHGKISIAESEVEKLHYVAAIAKRAMW